MAVKTYPYGDMTQLSKDFNINEFKCKCANHHSTKNATELIDMLQKIKDLVGADIVTISSGYRCSTHDRNVGGSGAGPHVDGYAADCQFIKNGKAINTKLLSCVAQDLGFKGIANITRDYSWIHLDMKGRVYKGDETINYNTLTNNFYTYFGITKQQILDLTNNVETGNNNVSSTSNPTKINNKDKSTSKFVYSNKFDTKIKQLQEIFKEKGFDLMIDGYSGPNTYAICSKFTIEKGDKGPLTRWVQERLNDLGYDCGIADGIAGDNTMNAIKSFQKANGLGQGYLGGTDWYYLIK